MRQPGLPKQLRLGIRMCQGTFFVTKTNDKEELDHEIHCKTAASLSFDLDDDVVRNVEFTRGCDGNLKAISKLVDGMTVDQIYNTLHGNTCGFKDTSCADQLAQAVRKCYDESRK